MANHRIPRTSSLIEALAVIGGGGAVTRCHVFRHVRSGHSRPEFFILQYAELPSGRIDRSTRWTRQYSGARARARLDADMADVREQFAAYPPAEPKPVDPDPDA